MASTPERVLVVAPSWLGDAVMAVPFLNAARRHWPTAHLAVAARRSVAPFFGMVDSVDEVVVLQGGGGLAAIAAVSVNANELARRQFDIAVLLPNSFVAAWTTWRAAIAERWGFRTDWRGRLLTRAFPRPPKQVVHQAEYYLALADRLGIAPAPLEARIAVPDEACRVARALLTASGLGDTRRFVVLAPGAAYGRAKQWLPERFVELARRLKSDRNIDIVLVGSGADAPVCREIAQRAGGAIDLSGRTDLPTLAAVLAAADAVVTNDSGAMHLATAVGARVVAIFGPTNEKKSAPLSGGRDRATPTIVATNVWCRPCMLRECPIDHRCMTRISADAVLAHL